MALTAGPKSLQAERDEWKAQKRGWKAKGKRKKTKRKWRKEGKKGGCFNGEGLRNALFPTLLHTHTLHADSPPLPRSYCLLCNDLQMCCWGWGWVGEGERGGEAEKWWWGSCLACHVLRRGETLSKGTLSALMEWLAEAWGRKGGGGEAKWGEGWEGGGQKDFHIWNHFRSAQALAVKGEPGRLAGERGTGVWHWTYHSQGSVIRKTTTSRK